MRDTLTIARAARSLRGAAANFGATLLAEIAAKTEIAITTSHGVEETLSSLALSSDAVVGAIRSALPTAPVTG